MAIKAIMTICKLLWIFLSQFFHSLLHFSNHAEVHSTTHLFGITTNLWSSFLFIISTLAPIRFFTANANGSPEYPPSADTFFASDNFSLALPFAMSAPFRSVTSAVVTASVCGRPWLSTALCLFIPDTNLPPSKPFSSAVSVFLTLWASIIQKLVFYFRPSASRTSTTNFCIQVSKKLDSSSEYFLPHLIMWL